MTARHRSSARFGPVGLGHTDRDICRAPAVAASAVRVCLLGYRPRYEPRFQPKLAARVRLLNTGKVNKKDPNDARSVAIAAMRSPEARSVRSEDTTAVLKLWAHRHRELSRWRNRTVCQLHAVLCDLVPGGFGGEITVRLAAAALDRSRRTVSQTRPESLWQATF